MQELLQTIQRHARLDGDIAIALIEVANPVQSSEVQEDAPVNMRDSRAVSPVLAAADRIQRCAVACRISMERETCTTLAGWMIARGRLEVLNVASAALSRA